MWGQKQNMLRGKFIAVKDYIRTDRNFETIISTSRLRNQEKEQIIINPKAKGAENIESTNHCQRKQQKSSKINETKAWF